MQTYNVALRYIPTPSQRSLVFHIDADLVALDAGFIENGLKYTQLGKLLASDYSSIASNKLNTKHRETSRISNSYGNAESDTKYR